MRLSSLAWVLYTIVQMLVIYLILREHYQQRFYETEQFQLQQELKLTGERRDIPRSLSACNRAQAIDADHDQVFREADFHQLQTLSELRIVQS